VTYREVGHCRMIDLDGTDSTSTELAELCNRIAWDEEARVVLLIFGDGIDNRLQTEPAPNQASLVESVAKLKLPVVAAIRGDAIGPALELALACDIRVGTENARFGLPQIRDGRIPCNGGTQRLTRLVGIGKAMQMILTGELINAEEACRIGFLNRVADSGSLLKVATALAQEMAGKSPLALSYVKEALYGGSDLTLDQGLRMELDLYLLLFTTSDRNEGITAFREKRKPDFKGN
jgi:enoyl-CoA hydratase/carnithine racemase